MGFFEKTISDFIDDTYTLYTLWYEIMHTLSHAMSNVHHK
jgi:hypothetical protein